MTPIDALRALLAFIDPKQMMSHEQQCVWFEAKRIVEEQDGMQLPERGTP